MPRLIPRDERFYDLFKQFAAYLLDAARKLEAMITEYDRLDERVAEIRAIEHQADMVELEIGVRLERAFMTPFDREDIHSLSSRLDDIIDEIQEVAEAFLIYNIGRPTPQAQRLAGILSAQSSQLSQVLGKLESLQDLEPSLREIHELENEADGLSRSAIAALFAEQTDAMVALKFREVYATLEEAIDAAEDAGEVIERIVAKAQ
ncbi:MAG: DUF47 domain-containing protein [Candidatus Limnocylindrales bacterium]|jgi:predicted phosphate transport protein (TIGR00153 family)